VLFREDALNRIRSGAVSVVFRRWRRARVRTGTKLRTMIGLIEVRSVAEVDAVDDADARLAGYRSAAALRADIPGDGAYPLFRMEVAYAGPDPRIALRAQSLLSAGDIAELTAKLDRMDRSSRRGAWTRTVLGLLAARPAIRAGDLFADAGYPDLQTFKRDVRRLKELGLTESLDVGYRLSPRGLVVLDAPSPSGRAVPDPSSPRGRTVPDAPFPSGRAVPDPSSPRGRTVPGGSSPPAEPG